MHALQARFRAADAPAAVPRTRTRCGCRAWSARRRCARSREPSPSAGDRLAAAQRQRPQRTRDRAEAHVVDRHVVHALDADQLVDSGAMADEHAPRPERRVEEGGRGQSAAGRGRATARRARTVPARALVPRARQPRCPIALRCPPPFPPRRRATRRARGPRRWAGPPASTPSGGSGPASGGASNSNSPSSTADFPSTRAWCILKTMPSLPVLEPGEEVEVPQRPGRAAQRLGQHVTRHRHERFVARRPGSRARSRVTCRAARGTAGRRPSTARRARAAEMRAAAGNAARGDKACVDAVRATCLQRGPGAVALEGKSTAPCDVHVRVGGLHLRNEPSRRVNASSHRTRYRRSRPRCLRTWVRNPALQLPVHAVQPRDRLPDLAGLDRMGETTRRNFRHVAKDPADAAARTVTVVSVTATAGARAPVGEEEMRMIRWRWLWAGAAGVAHATGPPGVAARRRADAE